MTSNPFKTVKETIHRRGWAKTEFELPNGSVCIMGAFDRSGIDCPVSGDLYTLLGEAIKNYRPEDWEGYVVDLEWLGRNVVSVPKFNDDDNTTLEDVDAVLDIAAKEWERDH